MSMDQDFNKNTTGTTTEIVKEWALVPSNAFLSVLTKSSFLDCFFLCD
ncbi:MAG: hypothetical protein HF962_00810 [Sulfurovum sp.]|nr:hypothetical protein [Sulfurovum sp.]